MNDDNKIKRALLERAVGNVQRDLFDLFAKYKGQNRAIKHFGLFGEKTPLAYSPDEEVQNPGILKAQYEAISQFYSPLFVGYCTMQNELKAMAKRPIGRDHGTPHVLKIQTAGGNAVGAVYILPLDPDGFVFSAVTTRAPLARDPYIVNEYLLFDDLERFTKEALPIVQSEFRRLDKTK